MGLITAEEAARQLNIELSRFRYLECLCQNFLSIPRLTASRKYSSNDLKVLDVARHLLDEGLTVVSLKIHLAKTFLQPAFPGEKPASCLSKAGLITVSSGKGGVGKSTLALNLGVELKRMGYRVVVVDLDFGTANLHLMVGMRPHLTLRNMILGECTIDEILLQIPGGPDIVPGASGIMEMANIGRGKRELLFSQLIKLQHPYDVIVVDTAAGVSESVIDFVAASDFAIAVTSPEKTSITDAYALIKLTLEKNRQCRLGLIANRVRSMKEGAQVLGRISNCARRFLNQPLIELGCVWEDSNVRHSINEGAPVAMAYPLSKASLAIRKLAHVLEEKHLVSSSRKSSSDDLVFTNRPPLAAAGFSPV